METIVFSVWIFNYDLEAAILQIIISMIAYGPDRYCQSWVAALDVFILILDTGAIVSSFTSLQSPLRGKAIAYFSFFLRERLPSGNASSRLKT